MEGREGGMRDDEEKEEEGYHEWLQAATSVRDFYFKRLRWRLFSPPVGKRRRMRSSKHRHLDEETARSRKRQSL